MIATAALPPTPAQVVAGVLAVVAAALIATASAHVARRSGNWLHYIVTAGGLLIVAGIVGQRTAVAGSAIGPWDAGIGVPVVGVHLDPVAAVGIVVCLAGLVVTLLFERVPDPGHRPPPLVDRPFDDDDTV